MNKALGSREGGEEREGREEREREDGWGWGEGRERGRRNRKTKDVTMLGQGVAHWYSACLAWIQPWVLSPAVGVVHGTGKKM